MIALRKILQGAGRGSIEITNKDILKALRLTIVDKALILRSTSAEVMKLLPCVFRVSNHVFHDLHPLGFDINLFSVAPYH